MDAGATSSPSSCGYGWTATIAGFAIVSPMIRGGGPEMTTAIAHCAMSSAIRIYESLARKGEAMTTAALAIYALDQIDQARAELTAVSK